MNKVWFNLVSILFLSVLLFVYKSLAPGVQLISFILIIYNILKVSALNTEVRASKLAGIKQKAFYIHGVKGALKDYFLCSRCVELNKSRDHEKSLIESLQIRTKATHRYVLAASQLPAFLINQLPFSTLFILT